MTLPASIPKETFLGNGSTTLFPFPHLFFAETDLLITKLTISTGVEEVVTTGFTVAGVGLTAGGSVTFAVAPSVDEKIVIERVVDLSQGAKYRENEGFPSAEHEKQMDRQTMMSQQVQNEIDTKVGLSTTTDVSAFSTKIVGAPFANRAIVVDPTNMFLKFSDTDFGAEAAAAQVFADAAAASAAAALVSENNAATSESNAATSETNAATSESNAATSETNAAASAASILKTEVAWKITTLAQIVIESGGTFVGVDSGTQFAFAGTITMDIEGTIGQPLGLNTGTEAADTHYYLIALGDTTNTLPPSAWFVTEANYASFTTGDLPTGFDDFKRIGSVRNNNTSNFLRGEYLNKRFYFADFDNVSIASSSSTDLDMSTIVPKVVREMSGHFTSSSSTTNAFFTINGFSDQLALWENAASGNADLDILLDSNQIFEGAITTGNLVCHVVSYIDKLEVEGQ